MNLLRHVTFFVTIAEERHFGRAAARLGMSQPPLSQGLRRLEEHLGARLFERNAREVVLTPAGERLLADAEGLLAAASRFTDLARRESAAGAVVRVGLVGQLRPRVGAALVAALRAAGPRTRVEIVPGPTAELTDRVARGRLDAAVVRHPGVPTAVGTGPVVRLAGRVLLPTERGADGRWRWSALRGLALAAPPRPWHPAAHDVLVDALARQGLVPRLLAIDDDRAALAAVAAGHAFAVTADPDLGGPGVTALTPAGDPLPLRFRAVWPRTGEAHPHLREAVTGVLAEEAAVTVR